LIFFQFAQLLGKHFSRGFRNMASYLAKSQCPGLQGIYNDRFPFTLDYIDGYSDGTLGKAHIALRLQNCAYWTRQPAHVKKELLEDEDSAARLRLRERDLRSKKRSLQSFEALDFRNDWS
jgi:hypothetical protein